ncbi:hypothetical protein JTE90_011645 [Oedothorax gibbosus]|uniref:Germinal-centre associated nuclear protein MCM3AP domain-containing protein n=1 Tax=Oedothorax gibbosus TaxID=931172 RepID=A0AAV6U227_9ARAC|nr:hypothetical protein JTE90_011645 [Oedothorax gibbosus]
MCQKFNLPSLPDARNKELASYSYVINGGRTVVSVTAIILGMENNGDCNEFMKGISAIILCCPSSFPNIMNFNVFVEKFDVLLKEANLLSAFPLFTIILDTNQKCNVLNQLSSFLDKRIYPEGCFSTLKMNHLPVRSGYVSNSSEVSKALKWLIVNQESRPILLCATLQNYLEDSYASAFNTLFWKISLEEFKPLVMFPQHIITFYNKVLDSRAQLLCSELLRSVFDCWPPQELKILNPGFKSIDKYLQLKASDLIKSLHLPEFNGEPACIEHVWQYVRDIGELSGNNAMLFIDVQTILQTNTYIDWPTIISKCAFHIIRANCNNLLDEMKDYVYYMKEDLDSLNFDYFWQSLLLLLKEHQLENRKRKFEESLEKTIQKKRKDLEQEDILYFSIGKTQDLGNISSISSIPLASSCRVEDMLSSLKSAFKKQKEEDEKVLFKLNESISGVYTEKDHDLNVVHDIISHDLPVITPTKQSSMDSLVSISPKSSDGISISEGTNTWDKFVGKKTKTTNSSPASLSEKLSELRYNIQKNNMLEDNLKRLLNL